MKYIKSLLLMIIMLFIIGDAYSTTYPIVNGLTWNVTTTTTSATIVATFSAINQCNGQIQQQLSAGNVSTNYNGSWKNVSITPPHSSIVTIPRLAVGIYSVTNLYSTLIQNTTYKIDLLAIIPRGITPGCGPNPYSSPYTNLIFTTSPVYTAPAAILSVGITNVVTTSAVFLGIMNPNGNSGLAHFEYAVGSAFGVNPTNVTAPLLFDNSMTNSTLTNLVTGLSLGSNYVYRLVASNSVAIVQSPTLTFVAGTTPVTTTNAAPILSGLSYSVNYTNVTFALQLNLNGNTGHVFFAWNNTPMFNVWNDVGIIYSDVGLTNVTYLVSNLNSYNTYYYTAEFVDGGSVTTSTNSFLYTGTPPVYTLAAVMVHGSNGVVDATTTFTDAYCDAPSTDTSLINKNYVDSRINGFSSAINLVVLNGQTNLLFVIGGVTNKVVLTTYP